MVRRTIAAGLVLLLAGPGSAAAGETVRTPIADAVSREARRAAGITTRRGAMPNGWKWTGLGLLMGSGLPAFAAHFGDCIPERPACDDQRRAAYAVTGVLAGAGVAVLLIADRKRPEVPVIVGLSPGRASIQHRLTF